MILTLLDVQRRLKQVPPVYPTKAKSLQALTSIEKSVQNGLIANQSNYLIK